jgi:DNA-binding CsgD family transcriptional regulator
MSRRTMLIIISMFLQLSIYTFAGMEKIENICIPKITNFDKGTYNAGSKIWYVAQNKKGYLYFANASGLLEYDGSQWTNNSLPNRWSMIRCIAIADDQKIYTGSQNEFGYWLEHPITGKLQYFSLSDRFRLKLNEEAVWKIIMLGDEIFFRTHKNIYRYNTKSNTISIIAAPHRFQFIFEVNKRVFVQEKEIGLMELKENKLVALAGGAVLHGDCVYGMVPLSPTSILIATIDKGLYRIDNDIVTKCTFPCDAFLTKNQVFSLCLLPNGRIAFGTILNGLLITDHNGNILSNINKQKGLANNTVLSIFCDKNENLWLGLDMGISHIQINSPIRNFPDPNGLLGSVYDVKEDNGRLYFATNQGLYYCSTADLAYPDREQQFTLLPNTQGQAWKLQRVGNLLFCCHNKGIFLINGTQVTHVYKGSGVNHMVEINDKTAAFSTYEGLCVLKIQGATYSVKKYPEYPYYANYLAKDKNNLIYIGNNNPVGIFQFKFDAGFDKIVSIKNKIGNISLNKTSLKGVYSDRNNLYLLDKSGIFKYNTAQGLFLPDATLNRLIPKDVAINRLQFTNRDMWCYASDRFFCIRNYDQPSAYLLTRNMESLYNQVVNTNENILNIAPDKYLVCTSNSFSVLNTTDFGRKTRKMQVYIRDIGTFTNKMHSLELENPMAYYAKHDIEFPNNHSTIFIRFTLPYYENAEKIRYSYRIKGSSDNFSIPSQSSMITFPHLPSGNYTFQVKATLEGTNEVYYSQDLQIRILPPWYLGWMGYVLLFLLLCGAAYLLNMYLKTRLQRQKNRIANEYEKEMAKMENNILQEQVRLQNEELLRITKTMLRKNKLMNKLDTEILKMSENKSIPAVNLRGLKAIVEINKNPEEEWKIFEMSFNNTYNNYLVNLSNRFPSLTTSDLKLAAYIRMNISSKEIASLLNISLKSIEMARYRLRKKLEIEHEQNLTAFLMSI